MILDFNEGWRVRQPLGAFATLGPDAAKPLAVTLPHDAMRDTVRTADAPGQGSSAYYPPAAFAYLKAFDVPSAWAGKVVLLEFGGAMRHAQVFVNEEFAGHRNNGYARFFVDATPFLRPGEPNDLRVEVRTGQDTRWYSGAGLHRDVRLHVLDPLHLVPDGVRATTVDLVGNQAVVEVAVTVTNRGLGTAAAAVQTRITDADGAPVDQQSGPATVPPGTTQVVRHRFYLDRPRLWSLDQPHLYTVQVALDGDDPVTARFGVRKITVDPRHGLRLNGQPLLLRGACIHHDNGPLGAAAIPRAEERRVELLKAAGFNAIRSAHNPASEALLEACDRLGVVVMDEAFDMWVRFKSPYDYAMDFPEWWREDLGAMVAKDYNHPSVIMYSIGNEIGEIGSPHGAVLARTLAEHLRSLDPTRPITSAFSLTLVALNELGEEAVGVNEALAGGLEEVNNRLSSSETVTRRTEETAAALDIVGLNYAEERYGPDAQRFPHRVVVGSETFGSRIGLLWPMVQAHPHVIGDFTWTGWDYLGEVGLGATLYGEVADAASIPAPGFPSLTAWCGDIDITGFRRPISYYREIVYGLRTEPYIAVRRPEHHDDTIVAQTPWAWSDSIGSWTWPGFEGKPITVEVYADADQVALLLDGEEFARSAIGLEKSRLAVFETVYRPGWLEAVAYRDGTEVARHGLDTAAEPTQLAATADRVRLKASPADLSYVALELRDGDGCLATAWDRPVTVEVSGPGCLAGLCSANPKTAERFDSPTWQTFDGRALAVIRPTGEGTIQVRAVAEGLPPVTVNLTAAS
ncbi:MAG: DUF4982 domain-containing protein [Bifidobacteriaceae bacterium]|jgi:hypothetical protein|nr:DUF4982 domain-containing protein [Bifidobacteriaceae bacterium]